LSALSRFPAGACDTRRMKTLHTFAIVAAVGLGPLTAGCAADREATSSTDDEVNGSYASPGKDLGKATHLVADVEGDAAFVVFDRALERRTADGEVEALAKIEPGFEHLVVSKSYAAYLTASFVNGGGSKVIVHVLSRAEGWKEVRKEDLSTDKAVFRHPIAFLDDGTLAVGSGEEVVILGADGTRSTVGGYQTRFRGGEVFALYPAGDASRFFVALDNGEVYDVDTKTRALTLQPKRKTTDTTLSIAFDPKTRTWITTDFAGIKIWGTDGKLAREADLVSPKHRFITCSTLLDDGRLLVVHDSERSQDRSVLATYDLRSMTRTEMGTFDGRIQELAPTKERLFFAFNPKGAEGMMSRVWYAHVLPL
jgi:hypothetical protein